MYIVWVRNVTAATFSQKIIIILRPKTTDTSAVVATKMRRINEARQSSTPRPPQPRTIKYYAPYYILHNTPTLVSPNNISTLV